jgi:hypothetical protein
MKHTTQFLTLVTLLALANAGLDAAERKYTKDVAKLAAAPAPAPGGILMVGSSIFRKWTTAADDLAPLPVTNRGFGGWGEFESLGHVNLRC